MSVGQPKDRQRVIHDVAGRREGALRVRKLLRHRVARAVGLGQANRWIGLLVRNLIQ